MVWAAIRFRMFGATAAVALLSIFAVDAADRSHRVIREPLDSRKLPAGCSISCCCAPRRCTWRRCSSSSGSRVNDSLRESEERFRIIADQAPMMMWTSGIDGGLRIRQPALAGFHRHDARTDPGQGLGGKSLHPDDMQTDVSTTTCNISTSACRWRWSTARGVTMANIDGFKCTECRAYGANGEFTGYIGSAIDHHRAPPAGSRAPAQRGAAIATWSRARSAFVCRFLPDATLTFVNSAYCRFLGTAAPRVVRRKFSRVAAASGARRGASKPSGAPVELRLRAAWECEVAHADGTRGWQSWVCHAIETAPEEAREIQAIGYDITDRKRAEESGPATGARGALRSGRRAHRHGGARGQPAVVRDSQQCRSR